MSWTLAGTKYLGIGVRLGDVLAVSYYGRLTGVIAYQITPDRLTGSWAVANTTGRLGVETLRR